MTAGAYGAVQAGTYNTRALIPEVLVRDSEWALVRPRLEADQLIALDRLPAGSDRLVSGSAITMACELLGYRRAPYPELAPC